MRRLRVLVAEDNEDHRFLTMRALRDVEGVAVDVEGVRDGAEAVAYVQQPRLSGLEVLARLKSDPRLSSIPVIVLTSSDRSEDVETAYRLGGNSYVAKAAVGGDLWSALRDVAQYWTARSMVPLHDA